MTSPPTSTARPHISIVLPVYGVEEYVKECLDSILAGSADGVEVVAVDDASPDRSGAILDGYARHDPRLRVIHLPTNVGLGPARNAGLAHATGEYVWFVDSDDWLPAGALDAVHDRLAATHPDVLILDHAVVLDDGRAVRRASASLLDGVPVPLQLAQQPRLLRLGLYAWNKVVRKEVLDKNELRFQSGWYEDCAYGPLVLMAADSIDFLDQICYCYRQRQAGQITATVSSRHFDVFAQYELLFTEMERAGQAYDVFRPDVFRLMVDHYLVIIGNETRVPPGARREFFRRVARDYRRWRPADGYPVPEGVAGLKHRLVSYDSYPAYAILRRAHRLVERLRRTTRSGGAPPVGIGKIAPSSLSSTGTPSVRPAPDNGTAHPEASSPLAVQSVDGDRQAI